MVPQVVLVLDNREQFGHNVGGRVQASRADSRNECLRQLRNLGINVDVGDSAYLLLFPIKLDTCSRKQVCARLLDALSTCAVCCSGSTLSRHNLAALGPVPS